MPSNNTGASCYELAERYPGRIGHLFSPGGLRANRGLPFALDNGRFPCWSAGRPWVEADYRALLEAIAAGGRAPLWVLVPDVVADPEATIAEWQVWAPELAAFGWPLAFAVQDGMRHGDVPAGADVVFVGGSTAWKRRTLHDWCRNFPRVHVGRINTNRWLWECHEAGAESCDGTGWFRGDLQQLKGLVSYLERSSRGHSNHRGQRLFS